MKPAPRLRSHVPGWNQACGHPCLYQSLTDVITLYAQEEDRMGFGEQLLVTD